MTAEAKERTFTPGPWSVNDNYDLPRVSDGDGRMIAEVFNTTGEPRGDALANARLIAAAPELLAAAKDVLNAEDADQHHHALVRLEEAITKAEGAEDA